MAGRDEVVWSALSDPTRRKILDLLKSGPRTTGAICGRFPVSRTAVMKHLDVLEEARLILIRRRGRQRWNYINAAPLRRIYERWMTPFQQLWAASLSKLGTIAEENYAVSKQASLPLAQASIAHELEIGAPPERVFEALTKNIASWWSHVTYDCAGKPDLRLEAAAGGRLYETSGPNQRLYALVTRYEPCAKLWLEGAMGMEGCVLGTITFELEPKGEHSTSLAMLHSVVGQLADETVAMYRGGWSTLLDDGLKEFVESGKESWSAA